MIVDEMEYMNRKIWVLKDEKNDYRPAVEANLFLRRQVIANHSPNTVKNYAYHLKTFYEFMSLKGIPVLHIADNLFQGPVEILTEFGAWLQNPAAFQYPSGNTIERKPVCASTVNTIMGTVIDFYEFQINNETVDLSSMLTYKKQYMGPGTFSRRIRQNLVIDKSLFLVKEETNPLEYITREQYQELYAACGNNTRNKLLVSLYYELGLRAREAIGILVDDLTEIESRKIKLVPRENNKNGARIKNYAGGTLFAPPYVINNLTNYVIESCSYNKSGFLFVNQQGENKGEPMSYINVVDLFKRLGKKIGLPEIHPHMLRHGFATEKLWYGWRLEKISRWLRHASLESTMIYIHILDEIENCGGPIGTFDMNRISEGGFLQF